MGLSQVWKQAAASARVTFEKRKHFTELARTRAMLSGDQPLDVYIKGSTEVRFGTRTANLLREHISRFQNLEIRAPEQLKPLSLQLVKAELPRSWNVWKSISKRILPKPRIHFLNLALCRKLSSHALGLHTPECPFASAPPHILKV